MGKIYFPFNSIMVDGKPDRAADAETLARYLGGVITNGVIFSANSLKVATAGGMGLNILPGTAYINGKIFYMDEAEAVTLDTANATLDRIDRIVVRLSEIERKIDVAVLKGTPASTPQAPALTRGGDVYELCLAEVRVPAAVTAIAASYITDTRKNKELCGWVTDLIRPEDEMVYSCNGSNDNVTLKTFIDTALTRQNQVYIRIKGQFGSDGSVAQGYAFAYTGNNNVVLDFSDADVVSAGAFIYADKITVKGLKVSATGGTADARSIIYGVDAILEGCSITGDLNAADGKAYNVTGGRMINCRADVTNSQGTGTGIECNRAILEGCDISATSKTASAYALNGFVTGATGCVFTGKTESADTTASGNGAICSGNFANCTFIGIGALKGQGLFLRTGYYLQATGCIFRGYTADTANGWGIGITGATDSGITIILAGALCNSVALNGFTQTGALKLADGYGAISGIFYTAVEVPTTIASYGAFSRNRV